MSDLLIGGVTGVVVGLFVAATVWAFSARESRRERRLPVYERLARAEERKADAELNGDDAESARYHFAKAANYRERGAAALQGDDDLYLLT